MRKSIRGKSKIIDIIDFIYDNMLYHSQYTVILDQIANFFEQLVKDAPSLRISVVKQKLQYSHMMGVIVYDDEGIFDKMIPMFIQYFEEKEDYEMCATLKYIHEYYHSCVSLYNSFD